MYISRQVSQYLFPSPAIDDLVMKTFCSTVDMVCLRTALLQSCLKRCFAVAHRQLTVLFMAATACSSYVSNYAAVYQKIRLSRFFSVCRL